MACLLTFLRGIAGGYSLGRPADKITIRDLVELLEGIETNQFMVVDANQGS